MKGANNLIEFKTEILRLRIMDYWPASSPDFNPVEKIWRLLKQRRMQRGPFLRLEDLKATLREEWAKLTQEEIQQYIKSMPARLREAEERNGWATSY